MRIVGLNLITAVAFALVACGSTQPDRVTTFLVTLDKASYADCAQQRDEVGRYLLTGEPRALDGQYLPERTQVLKQPQAVQDAYARQYVNELTAACDTSEKAANDRTAYVAACSRLGGKIAASDSTPVASVGNPKIAWIADTYKAGECTITYFVREADQDLTYAIPPRSDGSVDTVKVAENRDVRCQDHPEDFYSDTGVCVIPLGWV